MTISGTTAATKLRRRGLGVSLIELLVVVALMLILSGAIIGIYAWAKTEQKVAAGAKRVNSLFITARSFAVIDNGWYAAVFQFRNPVTNAKEATFWIDEVYKDSASAAATATNPFPPSYLQRKRPRITTPIGLPSGVELSDVVINTTGTVLYNDSAYSQVAILFRGDGTSDQASVHLHDAAADPADLTSYYTVKLYGPTAKSKVFARGRR